MDAATSFTFSLSSEKKRRADHPVAIAETDFAKFQLKVGDTVKTLFNDLTAGALRGAWPSIANWDKVTWNDLAFIYNFVVTMMKPGAQWSSLIRMKSPRLNGNKTSETARDAMAVAIISDSAIARFNRLKWSWSGLDKLKPTAAARRTR